MELIQKNDSALAGATKADVTATAARSGRPTPASPPSQFEMPGLDGSHGMAELFDAASPARDERSPGQRACAGEQRIAADNPPPLRTGLEDHG
jgi:hypothetical protein